MRKPLKVMLLLAFSVNMAYATTDDPPENPIDQTDLYDPRRTETNAPIEMNYADGCINISFVENVGSVSFQIIYNDQNLHGPLELNSSEKNVTLYIGKEKGIINIIISTENGNTYSYIFTIE